MNIQIQMKQKKILNYQNIGKIANIQFLEDKNFNTNDSHTRICKIELKRFA